MGEDFDGTFLHAFMIPTDMQISVRPPPADSNPCMYFDWVLGTWLATWFLSILAATKAPVGFKLNRRFVRPENIFEVVFRGAHEPTRVFSSC